MSSPCKLLKDGILKFLQHEYVIFSFTRKIGKWLGEKVMGDLFFVCKNKLKFFLKLEDKREYNYTAKRNDFRRILTS